MRRHANKRNGPRPRPAINRFMGKVSPCPISGCWWWVGGYTRGGYGNFFIDHRSKCVRAHRAAWTLFVGNLPHGRVVCHKCDQPACVNPAHLFLGTQEDNLRDMAAKGRARNGPLPGEAHPSAKLTEADVRAIRALRGKIGVIAMGLKFGVSKSLISAIHARTAWRHIG